MTARDLVTGHVAMHARRFPDLDLAPLDTQQLDSRDAALARAIDHAVAARWLTFARVIESRLTRPWAEVEHKVQAPLLVGAAQMLLMDRLPDHAVINEAVQWAKDHVRAKAGGLVNAVLRKVAELRKELCQAQFQSGKRLLEQLSRRELPLGDGRVWQLNADVFDEDPLRRLSQQTSHPEDALADWLRHFGEERTVRLALHNIAHPPIIVSTPTDRQSVHGVELTQPHSSPGFRVFTGNRAALNDWLERHGNTLVQDPTAAAPVRATLDLTPSPATIIDACAGKGTKTRQLALLHPQARIIATDIDTRRLSTLREQFQGLDHVEVIEHAGLRRFDALADLLLLDVPCSNTGVLARRVEARYRFNRETLKSLIDTQRQIMADAIPLLAPKGRIVYSTCSIQPEENEQQAAWLDKWHRMRVAKSLLTMPEGLPGENPANYRDGGYFAILERIK